MAAREQTAIRRMLPWLLYVHCTKLNPSLGGWHWTVKNPAHGSPWWSCLLVGSSPWECCTGHITADEQDSCPVLCHAWGQLAGAPTQWHHLHSKLGCKKQSCESKGGAKGLSLNPMKYSGSGLVCCGWFREQSFSLPLWTKSIEWNINNLGALGHTWWLYRFLIEQWHWLLKAVLYIHLQHAAKYSTRTSREPSANNKIANYNHTAWGKELFCFAYCFEILKIFIFSNVPSYGE